MTRKKSDKPKKKKIIGKSAKKSVKPKKSVKSIKPKSSAKTYKGKKKGRKPSVTNKYNAIKQAISLHYLASVNRRVKRIELKIIYDWIKARYGNQSIRYILMNIDVVLDNFWQEYCNLYPVNINNHARVFEWYNFKNYLKDEIRFHYPTDIIEVDLTAINEGIFEFFMEDYASKSEEYYEKCKSAGIKRESPPPTLFLENAYCDIAKKGNVFKYKLLLDEDMPSFVSTPTTQTTIPPPQPPIMPETAQKQPQTTNIGAGVGTGTVDSDDIKSDITSSKTNKDIELEKIKLEHELKQQKLKELAQLLKDGVITFEQYIEAIKLI